MTPKQSCPRCGAEGHHQGWEGACPACLLEFGWRGYSDEAHPSAIAEPSSAPSRLGAYERLDRIGSGGMGEVYRALQISLNRVVALKTLREELCQDPRQVHRFRSEAETAAQLNHPNIVAIYEVGTQAGRPYFAMEYVEGRSLAELVKECPLSPTRAASLMRTVARAVHHAHTCGVLHRDLKPSNVMLDPHGEPRILDFGLAKFTAADLEATLPGVVLGSPSYMPPEQALGRSTDARSDVYALGAILYELITGRAPFRADSALETLRLVREEDPAPPRLLLPRIPRDLETICLHCLSKDPADRYPTAQALAEDLERFLNQEPIRAQPAGLATRIWRWSCRRPLIAGLTSALTLALLAGLGGITYEWRREQQQRLRAERSEAQALAHLYAADMSLAQQAYDQADFGQTRALLARHAPHQNPTAAHAPSLSDPFPAATGFEWRYLWHATRPDPHQHLLGHDGTTCGLVVSPDGQTLYSAAFDGRVRAQPLTDGAPAPWVIDVGFQASSLALHPALRSLVVGGDPTSSGLLINTRTHTTQPLAHGGVVQPAIFSPDGQWLLKGSMEGWISGSGTLTVFDLEGRPLTRLPESGGLAAFSADGHVLVTGSWKDQLRIWDWPAPAPGQVPVPQLSGSLLLNGELRALAMAPVSNTLVTAHAHGGVSLWDLENRRLVGRLPRAATGSAVALAWSPDGRQIATGGEDHLIRVWDAETLALRWIARGHTAAIWCLAWTPDGQRLISAGERGAIRSWPNTPPPMRDLVVTNVFGDFQFSGLVFSHDSRWFAASLNDGTLGLWNVQDGRRVATSPLGTPKIHAAFSADDRELIVACGHSEVRRFRVPDLLATEHTPLAELPGPAVALALSEDGARLAATQGTTNPPAKLVLWDTRTGALLDTLQGHTGRIMVARFSPDGRRLASGGFDRTARVWDLEHQEPTHVLTGAAHAVTTLSFDERGETLAAGSWDGLLHLWQLTDGAPLPVPRFHDGVLVPEFIPKSGQLAVMSQASGVRLVDLTLQRVICLLRWPEARPYRYARSSPDGETFAVQSEEGFVRLWRAPRPSADDLPDPVR
ncbi:MAG: protein kinase [Verrucomicrobiales bacterium]|nr:protein kinase [Verrucomicrobiales bacterium]